MLAKCAGTQNASSSIASFLGSLEPSGFEMEALRKGIHKEVRSVVLLTAGPWMAWCLPQGSATIFMKRIRREMRHNAVGFKSDNFAGTSSRTEFLA